MTEVLDYNNPHINFTYLSVKCTFFFINSQININFKQHNFEL